MLVGVDVRPHTDQDLVGCDRALEAVHSADGYPNSWLVDPAEWLSPSGCAAAWVAHDVVVGSILGHVCIVRGVDDLTVASLHLGDSYTCPVVSLPAMDQTPSIALLAGTPESLERQVNPSSVQSGVARARGTDTPANHSIYLGGYGWHRSLATESEPSGSLDGVNTAWAGPGDLWLWRSCIGVPRWH